MILLSVIIPCYNHGKYIQECVESVLKSSIAEIIEIIIINDGSTDNGFTRDILNSLKRENITIIHQENQGLGKTRNNAIKEAKGIYILPLDADNFVSDSFLVKSVEILNTHAEVGIVYPDRIIIGSDNKKSYCKTLIYNKNLLLLQNYIDACAMFRKEIWEMVNGYDENMPVMGFEDWDFWIRCSAKNIIFYHLKNHFFYYRDLDSSMIKSTMDKFDVILEYIMKKNITIYAQSLKDIKKEYSYLTRKPFLYMIRRLFNKPPTLSL